MSLRRFSLLLSEHLCPHPQAKGSMALCALPSILLSQPTCARASSSSSSSSSSSDNPDLKAGSACSSGGGKSVLQIRAELFGNPVQPQERTGRRVLSRKLQGADLASWYFNPPTVPGIHNEERE